MLTRSAAAFTAIAFSPGRIARAEESRSGRKIAVTIDDGPATGSTRDLEAFVRISDALREAFVAEKVPAIMFVNERQLNIDGQRDVRVAVVNRWLEAGLDLGNHTYSHLDAGKVMLSQFLDDIVKGEVISRPLLEARDRKLVWFRYPFLATGTGQTAKAIEDFLATRAYRIAPVSVDYHDYSFAGVYSRHLRAGDREKAEEQFATVLAALDQAFDRAERRSLEVLGYELPQTLLIHCNEMNALTLPRTLQRIRARGYTFISLDEAMNDPAYQTKGLRAGALGGGGLFNAIATARRETGAQP
jgi:peptidoglycan/xylan/chitin deacetylase (PgdA/CDA1 family)